MKTKKDAKTLTFIYMVCILMLILSVVVYFVGFYTKNGFDLGKLFSLCINVFVFSVVGLGSYKDYKKLKKEEKKD